MICPCTAPLRIRPGCLCRSYAARCVTPFLCSVRLNKLFDNIKDTRKMRAPFYRTAVGAGILLSTVVVAADECPIAERKYIDNAIIQFFGRLKREDKLLELEDRLVVEGRGVDIHAARLDALRKLDDLPNKIAKVTITFAARPTNEQSFWHYWWHNAGDHPHWKACGKTSPKRPVSPWGLKMVVTENENACRIEVRPEPTHADLFWDANGSNDDPKVLYPNGLEKPEK